MRRVIAGLFILLLVGTAGWLATEVLAGGSMARGTSLPALGVRTAAGGSVFLETRAGTPTAIVLFHSRCQHCHSQLDALARDLGILGDTRVYLLTTEESLPAGEIQGRWRTLAAAPNVVWGTVAREDFQREFGVLSTPVTFAFGPEGRLRETVVGEVRIGYLAAALGR